VAESTLTLSLGDLNASVGAFLGYGRGNTSPYAETAWSTLQSSDITECVKSGLSQIYTPPLLPGEKTAHNWSFLRPYAALTLTAAARAIDLPDGFGGFEGPVLVLTDTGRYWPVPVVNDQILEARVAAQPDTTGAPVMCCERVAVTIATQTEATRSTLAVWPLPDQTYTLRASYYYHPDMLTSSLPYPPGASAHSELFKASCIAAAELLRDDERGVRWAYFMDRLQASVYVDRKRKGQKLGYNGDGSDCHADPLTNRQLNRFGSWGNPISVNGSVPG
jgi:hypothetical protein